MSRARRVSSSLFAAIVCVGVLCTSLEALDSPSKEIPPEERLRILERFEVMQRDIRTLRASVTQEKRVTALKKTIHSQGTIVLAKPNLLRWEVSGAERSVTVVDGETMTVYHPATNEAQVYALSENVAARATMAIFASALTGALQEMEKRFAVKIFRRERAIVFQLVPLSRIAGRYLSTILICYDEQSGLPQEFEITTGKGDRALTKLTDIEVNPSLQPHTFELKLPADVWITNRFQDNSN